MLFWYLKYWKNEVHMLNVRFQRETPMADAHKIWITSKIFTGHPALAAQRPSKRLSERACASFAWTVQREVAGRKKILSTTESWY